MNPSVPLWLIMDNPVFWHRLRGEMTVRQWKWLYCHIIGGMSIEELAIQENTTADIVNTWGEQVARLSARCVQQPQMKGEFL